MVLSIDSVFWNCIYYIGIDCFIIFLLIELLNQFVSKFLIWGAIIFTAEHGFIISSLIAKPKAYYDTLTNQNMALFLTASIIIVYIVVSLIEYRKWKKLGNG